MMNPDRRRGRSRSSPQSPVSDSPIILMIAVAMVSFFLGTMFTAHMNIYLQGGGSEHHFLNANVEELAQKRVTELQRALASKSALVKFPETTKNYAQGMARVSKEDFFEHFHVGVPMDPSGDNDSDVLMIYSHEKSFPKSYNDPSMITDDSSIPSLETKAAVRNCDYVHVILADHPKHKNQCTAIVPNYESYHIQKWMRAGKKGLDRTQDFSLVSRGMTDKGREHFPPPKIENTHKSWGILKTYFESLKEATTELRPLLQKVATPKRTVTVMVSNFGQSELLVNFVCAAKSRNLDISSVIVFATDLETKQLAESLGLVAFFDHWNYGEMPSEAANVYGDKKFTAMMLAKVMCVQMVSSLGYNILFQDVDIVWYKNPIPYFEDESSELQDFDIMFQDDGGRSTRYAPFSANSGFYFVRYNARTQYFFSSLLSQADLIIESNSHQQALIALLSEHVSLYALKVKVFSKDTDEFPGGFHFHQKTRKYMRRFFAGEADPYIFHMSWTKNKDNKKLFFEQLGEWYVHDQCIQKKPDEEDDVNFVSECCLVEPTFKCHYKDKPSKLPCYDSPPIDKGGKSFWEQEK